jgi:protein SCO1/2
MKLHVLTLWLLLISILFICCENKTKLPILGNSKFIDGKEIPHKIRDFSFINQDSMTITNRDYEDKIYVVDFFFTTCPTICPTVMTQMLRIYDKYENNPMVSLLSHTLDPDTDSIPALKAYANNLEIYAPKWNLVTGEEEIIHSFAADYMNIVVKDKKVPKGINHSGKIVLVDKTRRIRAFAEGTDPDEVTQLLEDIDKLIQEYEK